MPSYALPPNISPYSRMNSSNISAYSSPYARLDWQIAQILWVGYFSVTAYLFLALCFYLISDYRRKCRRLEALRRRNSSQYRKEKQLQRKRGALMYMFVLLAFVFAVVEMGINEWGILHMSTDAATCKSWRQVHHLAFITSLVPGYIFLWIRQHAFYQDAMLRTLTTKCVRVFSYCVLSALFLGYGFFAFFFGSKLYMTSHEYIIRDHACFSGKHKSMSMINYGLASGLLVFYQGSLLFLFTYPIWKSSKEDGEISETMEVVMGYIRKCRTLTILGSATDIGAFLFASFFKKIWNAPLHLLTCIYDIDLLINLLCLLMCLKPWKDIILPFRVQRTSVCKTSRRDISYVNSDRQQVVRAQESKAALLVRQQSIELIERGEESPEAERNSSPEGDRNSSPEGDRPGYLNEFPLSPLEEKRLSHVGEIGDNRELVSD